MFAGFAFLRIFSPRDIFCPREPRFSKKMATAVTQVSSAVPLYTWYDFARSRSEIRADRVLRLWNLVVQMQSRGHTRSRGWTREGATSRFSRCRLGWSVISSASAAIGYLLANSAVQFHCPFAKRSLLKGNDRVRSRGRSFVELPDRSHLPGTMPYNDFRRWKTRKTNAKRSYRRDFLTVLSISLHFFSYYP